MRSMSLLASDEFQRRGALSYYACSCRSVSGSAGASVNAASSEWSVASAYRATGQCIRHWGKARGRRNPRLSLGSLGAV